MRRRLDAELVRRKITADKAEARSLIAEGKVLVSGSVASNEARMVDPGEPLLIKEPPRFVGRGAEKLSAALENFGVDPAGLEVLDVGASTGGFTDCLLQAGAARVVALDVGHNQLHESLRGDDRVVVLERTNLRYVTSDDLGTFDGIVGDLSFISLTTVMEKLFELAGPGAWLILLIKPQFEAARPVVSRSAGVITDPAVWRSTILSVLHAAVGAGATIIDLMRSPLKGADGNVEFLVHLVAPGLDPVSVRSSDQPANRVPAPSVAALVDRVLVDPAPAGHRSPGNP